MNSFYADLKDGKQTENDVLSIIKKKYPKSYIIEGYFKDYDIYIPNYINTCEYTYIDNYITFIIIIIVIIMCTLH